MLAEVETVLASQHLIVDACRRAARLEQREVRLARRPVLFALLRSLAEAWPGEATREILCERAFGARRLNESHRARLRVELGRLRKELALAGRRAGHAARLRAAAAIGRSAGPGAADRESRTPRCSRSWPMAKHGPPRRSLWRSARASGRCSARSVLSRRPARCARSVAAERAAGSAAPIGGFATTLLLPAPPGMG